MRDAKAAETDVINRYTMWKRWRRAWDYKLAKGRRIVRIMTETGGC
jgi:hypothetical protein